MFRSLKGVIGIIAMTGLAVQVQAVELNSVEQRFSYAVGYQFAQQLQQQGIRVEGEAFGAALDDVLQGKGSRLSLDELRESLKAGREALVAEKKAKADQALEAGKKFLEENGKKEGVVTLPSGLQYLVITPGKGEMPGEQAKVTVHYRGTLINGEEFDSSYKRGKPTSFSLDGVIPGFREAISRMKNGAKWKVFIPSALGYGDVGAPGAIGPNETLIFDIELVSFEVKAQEKPASEQ
jgi:FKBP-type peptidyl-prolyl cis-trans isomerase FklB